MNNKYAFYLFFLILLVGCKLEVIDYDDVPFIEMKEVIVEKGVDGLGNPSRNVYMHFYLIDGDGDIIPMIDTANNFFGNCYIQLYYLDNDIFYKDKTVLMDTLLVGTDSIVKNVMGWYNIPNKELGQDIALKADVYIDISYNYGPPVSYDTFRFSIQVFDFALNASNIIWSDTLILN